MGYGDRHNPFGKKRVIDPVVLDCWARPLQEGDEVILSSQVGQPFFRVMKIAPVIDPNLPPNVMAVDLICRWRVQVARNQATPALILTRTVEELAPVVTASEAEAAPKLVEP